jgi:hypothetical protein
MEKLLPDAVARGARQYHRPNRLVCDRLPSGPTANRLAVIPQCKRSFLALNCRDGERISRLLLEAKQPRPWLDRAAAFDPKRTPMRFTALSSQARPPAKSSPPPNDILTRLIMGRECLDRRGDIMKTRQSLSEGFPHALAVLMN